MKYFVNIGLLLFCSLNGYPQNEWAVQSTGISEDLHDIEFISDSVGFVYSYGTGNIYRTVDAGRNWKKVHQSDSLYLEQIQFIDRHTGWICGERGTILKTMDGGSSWRDWPIRADSGNLLLYGMCFLNDSLGYVTGGCMDEKYKITPNFLKTSDGGITWTKLQLDIPLMILNLEKCRDGLMATGNGFIIEINTNNHEWRYLFRDTAKAAEQIRDIDFNGSQTGIAVSFNGNLIVTRDDCKTWTIQPLTTNRLRSIAYTGNYSWISAGDNNNNEGSVLYESTDDGINWEKISDYQDIHRISQSDKLIWIAGKQGFIGKKKK